MAVVASTHRGKKYKNIKQEIINDGPRQLQIHRFFKDDYSAFRELTEDEAVC